MFTLLRNNYSGVFHIFRRYWHDYGSWKALLFSPYFHFSILLTFLLSHFWQRDAWWDVALSVLPSVIGFSLGGFAIWLGFGDEKFRQLISEKDSDDEPSPYLQLSATFAHFIIIQLIALCCAIIAKATNYSLCPDHWIIDLLGYLRLPSDFLYGYIAPIFYFVGFLLFIYALMTAMAATLAVFRVASWFDKYRNQPPEK